VSNDNGVRERVSDAHRYISVDALDGTMNRAQGTTHDLLRSEELGLPNDSVRLEIRDEEARPTTEKISDDSRI